MSSFKGSRNIQRKERGPDRSVSDNQSSSVTLNELAEKVTSDAILGTADRVIKLSNPHSRRRQPFSSIFSFKNA